MPSLSPLVGKERKRIFHGEHFLACRIHSDSDKRVKSCPFFCLQRRCRSDAIQTLLAYHVFAVLRIFAGRLQKIRVRQEVHL